MPATGLITIEEPTAVTKLGAPDKLTVTQPTVLPIGTDWVTDAAPTTIVEGTVSVGAVGIVPGQMSIVTDVCCVTATPAAVYTIVKV